MRQRILAGIILTLTAATSNAALLGRVPLTPGGTDYQAYYDTNLNITWMADANAAAGSIYDDSVIPFGAGEMTRDNAQAWVASLNTDNYLGVTDWRLPIFGEIDICIPPDWGSADLLNELCYMYHFNQVTPSSPQPFANLQGLLYWTGMETPFAFFYTSGGGYGFATFAQAWAVRPGDIGTAVVPIPPAVWLFGSALGLMGWMRRKATS